MNWTAVTVAVIALIGTCVNAVFLYKAQKAKKNSKPNNPVAYIQTPNGRNFLCLMHGEKITKLEMKVQKACEDIGELKQDVRLIKEKVR